MYKIKIVNNFSAAHFLRGYKGKCESLHGHNWKVEVLVLAARLNSLGMVMDFSKLKKMTKDVLKKLDHSCLNDLDYFKKYNPSSENISHYIFLKLKNKVYKKGCNLNQVRVWETENSCAGYQELKKE